MTLESIIALASAIVSGGLLSALLKARAENAKIRAEAKSITEDINERIFARLERLNAQLDDEVARHKGTITELERQLDECRQKLQAPDDETPAAPPATS